MKKGDARRLLKERGATRLNHTSMAVLGQMLESVFIPRDSQATTPLESVRASFTLPSLASKCGLSENTVKKHLDIIISLRLARIEEPEQGKRRTYTLDFTAMLDWKKTRSVRDKRDKERREKHSARMREHRARVKNTPRIDDDYADLLEFAQLERVAAPDPVRLVQPKPAPPAVKPTQPLREDNELDRLETEWKNTPLQDKALRAERRQAWIAARQRLKAAQYAGNANATDLRQSTL